MSSETRRSGLQYAAHVWRVLNVFVFLVPAWAYPLDVAKSEKTVSATIDIASPDELDRIESLGVSVGSFSNGRAIVFGSPDKMRGLEQEGFRPRLLPVEKAWNNYPTYEEISSSLQELASTYSQICYLISIGTSVEGRTIWGMLITDNPDIEEDEPEFRYVSTIHGNEPLGTVLCLDFIELLLTQYGVDNRLTSLVDETAIWIVPLMNPDGYARRSRFNAAGVDLNRSFPRYPDDFTGTRYSGAPLLDASRQPETAALMRFTANNSFVLSANFHTGSLVVNYPYDDDGKPSGVYSACPDDALFRWLSLEYARNNPEMFASPYFYQGITNGAAWYVIRGGMQDWMYRYAGCCEVTIELANTFEPPVNDLGAYWAANRESMLAYLEAIHCGVRGIVTDKTSGMPLFAQITVEGNAQPVFSDPDIGDYYRLLLPGEYTLTFRARGYRPITVSQVVVDSSAVTRLDVQLERDPTGSNDPDQRCPAEYVFENDAKTLSGLRIFRDKFLNKFAFGKELVALYYRYAPYTRRAVQDVPLAETVFRTTILPIGRLALFLSR